jgi:hypothetical protein
MKDQPNVTDSRDLLLRALAALDRGGRDGFAEGQALLADLGDGEVARLAVPALREAYAAVATLAGTDTAHVLDHLTFNNLTDDMEDTDD